jgi:hypothetical protein
MSETLIGYNPIELNKMPEIRQTKDILKNLAPGKLPAELDFAISSAIIRRMSK